MSSAILLIAHGSRRAAANDDLVKLADMMRLRQSGFIVEIAYLELAPPDIPTGLQNCVAQGVQEIRMLPYFLSDGSHVSRDLEGFRAQFQQQHSEVRCVLCPPLGLHDSIVDVLLSRVQEVYSAG